MIPPKDIEDAKYLYTIFKDKLNLSKLAEFKRKLNMEKKNNQYL
jgi:hypothetical protein